MREEVQELAAEAAIASPSERPRPLSPLNPGDVPKDWEVRKIGSVSHKVTNGFVGSSIPHQVSEPGITYLQGFNIRPSRIELTKRTYVTTEFHQANAKSRLKAGDILVVQSGHIGTVARVPDDFGEANCHALIIVDVDRKRVEPDYVVEHFNSWIGQARLRGLHVGSSMLHINTSELADYRIPLPPLPEQRKIAAILRNWDEALEKLNALRALNIRRRIWLRTHLFTGKVRLPGFTGEWHKVPLSDVLHEHGSKSTGTEEVYSVSVHKGLVNQVEHLGRSFSAASTDHYNRVLPGDIVYTKSPTGDFPFGIIKQSKIDREVIVSPLYGVFTPQSYALGVILDALFESPLAARNYLHPLVQKGAKNTIAVTNKQFLEGKLHLPMDPEEQAAIADVVNTSHAELACLDAEIKALTHQKRGLMQKLLTGEWRVEVDTVEIPTNTKEAEHAG
ncbi:restriction endonuclease subunit S [Pontivivens nitratireducens]|nr:restriction endonuclease subunit S [Pontibrevibacter nitratireducens]